MVDIQHAIGSCLEYWSPRSTNMAFAVPDGNERYMEIPVNRDSFEFPVIASEFFCWENTHAFDTEYVVIRLGRTQVCRYKSVGRCIIEGLGNRRGLTTAYIIPNIEDNSFYYCTFGTIFNTDFIPVVMLSWQIETIPQEKSQNVPYKYKFIRPILRISPEMFRKSNQVEKYVINQILPKTLDIFTQSPRYGYIYGTFERSAVCTIQVIIDKIPFVVRRANTPSISTTNKELLDIALEHIDEVLQ